MLTWYGTQLEATMETFQFWDGNVSVLTAVTYPWCRGWWHAAGWPKASQNHRHRYHAATPLSTPCHQSCQPPRPSCSVDNHSQQKLDTLSKTEETAVMSTNMMTSCHVCSTDKKSIIKALNVVHHSKNIFTRNWMSTICIYINCQFLKFHNYTYTKCNFINKGKTNILQWKTFITQHQRITRHTMKTAEIYKQFTYIKFTNFLYNNGDRLEDNIVTMEKIDSCLKFWIFEPFSSIRSDILQL